MGDRKFETTAAFKELFDLLRDADALFLEGPRAVDEPYPVPQPTYGWAAADAAYAMGSFELGPAEALVLEGSSPRGRIWFRWFLPESLPTQPKASVAPLASLRV